MLQKFLFILVVNASFGRKGEQRSLIRHVHIFCNTYIEISQSQVVFFYLVNLFLANRPNSANGCFRAIFEEIRDDAVSSIRMICTIKMNHLFTLLEVLSDEPSHGSIFDGLCLCHQLWFGFLCLTE